MVEEDEILGAKILIVDDEEVNTRLLSEIFRKAGYHRVMSVTDSRQAVETYQKIKPDLFVLDLNMPHKNGFEIMSELRDLNQDTYLPIMVISHSEEQEERYRALESGAKDFLNKPYDRIEVVKRIRNLIEVRMLHNQVRDQNSLLEGKVKARTQELYDAQLDFIQRLSRAIEYRDCETGMHTIRMSKYAVCLAECLCVSELDLEMLLKAAPLHDIGKIGIPDSILLKPGKLTPEEWEIMKTHTTIGGELLAGSEFPFMIMAQEIAMTHHEKWDGTGYPNQLKGEEIPLIGRICCVSDVFDALTTERPYKSAWSAEESFEEIKNNSGTLFDPAVVDCFVKTFPQINEIREKYLDKKVEDYEHGTER